MSSWNQAAPGVRLWRGLFLAILVAAVCGGLLTFTAEHAPAVRDLSKDEASGGHTLAKHVGKTDAELLARMKKELRIASSSTFTDRALAERIVGETLLRESHLIDKWLARVGSRPNLVLHYRGDPQLPIGRCLNRRDKEPRPAWDAVVILKWHPTKRYFVLTAYPELRR